MINLATSFSINLPSFKNSLQTFASTNLPLDQFSLGKEILPKALNFQPQIQSFFQSNLMNKELPEVLSYPLHGSLETIIDSPEKLLILGAGILVKSTLTYGFYKVFRHYFPKTNLINVDNLSSSLCDHNSNSIPLDFLKIAYAQNYIKKPDVRIKQIFQETNTPFSEMIALQRGFLKNELSAYVSSHKKTVIDIDKVSYDLRDYSTYNTKMAIRFLFTGIQKGFLHPEIIKRNKKLEYALSKVIVFSNQQPISEIPSLEEKLQFLIEAQS